MADENFVLGITAETGGVREFVASLNLAQGEVERVTKVISSLPGLNPSIFGAKGKAAMRALVEGMQAQLAGAQVNLADFVIGRANLEVPQRDLKRFRREVENTAAAITRSGFGNVIAPRFDSSAASGLSSLTSAADRANTAVARANGQLGLLIAQQAKLRGATPSQIFSTGPAPQLKPKVRELLGEQASSISPSLRADGRQDQAGNQASFEAARQRQIANLGAQIAKLSAYSQTQSAAGGGGGKIPRPPARAIGDDGDPFPGDYDRATGFSTGRQERLSKAEIRRRRSAATGRSRANFDRYGEDLLQPSEDAQFDQRFAVARAGNRRNLARNALGQATPNVTGDEVLVAAIEAEKGQRKRRREALNAAIIAANKLARAEEREAAAAERSAVAAEKRAATANYTRLGAKARTFEGEAERLNRLQPAPARRVTASESAGGAGYRQDRDEAFAANAARSPGARANTADQSAGGSAFLRAQAQALRENRAGDADRARAEAERTRASEAERRRGLGVRGRAGEDFRSGFRGNQDVPIASQLGQTARFSLFYGGAYQALRGITTVISSVVQGTLAYEDSLARLNVTTNGTRETNDRYAASVSNAAVEAGLSGAEGVAGAARSVGLFGTAQSGRAEQQRVGQLSTSVAGRVNLLSGGDDASFKDVQTRFAGVLRSFGLANTDLTKLEDQLSVVYRETGQEQADTLDALASIGTLASSAGLDTADTASLVSRVATTTGGTPNSAAEALRQVLSKFNDPATAAKLASVGVDTTGTTAKEQIDQLAALNLTTDQLQAITSTFGRGASQQAATILIEQGGAINDIAQSARDAPAGSGQAQANVLLASAGQSLRLLGNEAANLAAKLGESGALDFLVVLLGATRAVVGAASGVLDLFNTLPRGLRSVAVAGLELLAVLKLVSAVRASRAASAAGLGAGATNPLARPAGQRAAAGALGPSPSAPTPRPTPTPAPGARAPSPVRPGAGAVIPGQVISSRRIEPATTRPAPTPAPRAPAPVAPVGLRARLNASTFGTGFNEGGAKVGARISAAAPAGVNTAIRNAATATTTAANKASAAVVAAASRANAASASSLAGARAAGATRVGSGAGAALLGSGALTTGVLAAGFALITIGQEIKKTSALNDGLTSARTQVSGASTVEDLRAAASAAKDVAAQFKEAQTGVLGLLRSVTDAPAIKSAEDNAAYAQNQADYGSALESAAIKADPASAFADFSDVDSVANSLKKLSDEGKSAQQQLDAMNAAVAGLATTAKIGAGAIAVIENAPGGKKYANLVGQSAAANTEDLANFVAANGDEENLQNNEFLARKIRGIDKDSLAQRTQTRSQDYLASVGKDGTNGPVELNKSDLDALGDIAAEETVKDLGKYYDDLSAEQKKAIRKGARGEVARRNNIFRGKGFGVGSVESITANAIPLAAQAGQEAATLAGGDAVLGATTNRTNLQESLASAQAALAANTDDDPERRAIDIAKLRTIKIAIAAAESAEGQALAARAQGVAALAASGLAQDDVVGRADASIAGLTGAYKATTDPDAKRALRAQVRDAKAQRKVSAAEATAATNLSAINPANVSARTGVELDNALAKQKTLTEGGAAYAANADAIAELINRQGELGATLASATRAAARDPRDTLGVLADARADLEAQRDLAAGKGDQAGALAAQAQLRANALETSKAGVGIANAQASAAINPGNRIARTRQQIAAARASQANASPEEFAQLQDQINSLVNDTVDYAGELAAARRQAATDPRDVVGNLAAERADIAARRSVAASRGDDVGVAQAQRAARENALAIAAAQREIIAARARSRVSDVDTVGNASVDVLVASQALQGTRVGEKDYYDAQRALRVAQRALGAAQRENAEAAARAGVSGGDAVGGATVDLRAAAAEVAALKDDPSSTAYYTALRKLADARRALAEAERARASNARKASSDSTSSVASAAGDLADARDRVRGAESPDERTAAKVDERRARSAAEGAKFNERIGDLQFADSVGDISHSAYLANLAKERSQLQERLRGMSETSEGYRQSIEQLQKIRELEKSAKESLNNQFNLGDIKLPTVYEVRRAIAAGGGVGTSVATNTATTNNVQINGADFGKVVTFIKEYLGAPTSVATAAPVYTQGRL